MGCFLGEGSPPSSPSPHTQFTPFSTASVLTAWPGQERGWPSQQISNSRPSAKSQRPAITGFQPGRLHRPCCRKTEDRNCSQLQLKCPTQQAIYSNKGGSTVHGAPAFHPSTWSTQRVQDSQSYKTEKPSLKTQQNRKKSSTLEGFKLCYHLSSSRQ